MKHLIIKDEKAYYSINGTDTVLIEQIGKQDILDLLKAAIEDEAFEIDEYKEEAIKNPAQNIIYKHIYEKFSDLLDNKQSIMQTAESKYKDAFEKYSGDLESEDL